MCHLFISDSSLILWPGWDKKNPFTILLQVTTNCGNDIFGASSQGLFWMKWEFGT